MTRSQRAAHAITIRVLAVFALAAIGFALARRHVVSEVEAAPMGRVAPHDARGAAP